MFVKHDKSLSVMRILTKVVFVLLIVGCVAGGIAMIVMGVDGSDDEILIVCGILLMPVGIFFAWLAYMAACMGLALFCDVKLIRNKLYGQPNDNLSGFLNAGTQQPRSAEEKTVYVKDVAEQLRELKKLYESGAIGAKEFTEEKERILRG